MGEMIPSSDSDSVGGHDGVISLPGVASAWLTITSEWAQ